MTMYTSRTISGPLSSLFDPPFRLVNFSDSPAIVLVSTHLRHAWTALPTTETPNASAIGAFIKANHDRNPEQRLEVPQNNDKDTVDTPWREMIYESWNHVFYDVSNFLQEVGPGIGHLHPPRHEVFGVEFPIGDREGGVITLKKVWSTNILLIPAHLQPGVSLRVSSLQSDEHGDMKEEDLGTFDASTPTEIWYLRSGVEIKIHIEGERVEENCKGIAAVLVVGILCIGDHEEDNPEQRGLAAESQEVEIGNSMASA